MEPTVGNQEETQSDFDTEAGPSGSQNMNPPNQLLVSRVEPARVAPRSVPIVPSCANPGANLSFNKYPYLVETYKNTVTHVDMVFLAVSIPGGATHVRLDLNSGGTAAIVSYKWPSCFINMEDLFKKSLAQKQMTMDHPKVIAARNGLEKVTIRRDEEPDASINIPLPISVQTDDSTWSYRREKRQDGTMFLLADFKGHLNDFNRSAPNHFIEFED